MLYPNFANWTALSTNHLEVGVHVRRIEDDQDFARKKSHFELPLMKLPTQPVAAAMNLKRNVDEQQVKYVEQPRAVSILDLPLEKLPAWVDLPVVDLWGHLSNEEEIALRGIQRYDELITDCRSTERSRRPLTPLCRVGAQYDDVDYEVVDIDP